MTTQKKTTKATDCQDEAFKNCTMMKLTSPKTGEGFIVTAEWSNDSPMVCGLAELIFMTAVVVTLEGNGFDCIYAGHDDAVGALNVIMEKNHPTALHDVKKKVVEWLTENTPDMGVKYHTYTLDP